MGSFILKLLKGIKNETTTNYFSRNNQLIISFH